MLSIGCFYLLAVEEGEQHAGPLVEKTQHEPMNDCHREICCLALHSALPSQTSIPRPQTVRWKMGVGFVFHLSALCGDESHCSHRSQCNPVSHQSNIVAYKSHFFKARLE